MQYTIPPDFRVELDALASSWSIPLDVFNNIWKDQIGQLKVAILDTGAVKHSFLPNPVEAKSFTGEAWQDGNGHGCVAPSDVIYTSMCGTQEISKFWDNCGGTAFFNQDGSVIKDVSRQGIYTFGVDELGSPIRSRITHAHKIPYSGEVFEVDIDGERLTLTPWHPVFKTWSRAGKKAIKKIRADEIKVGDSLLLMPSNEMSISDEYLSIEIEGKNVPLSESFGMFCGLVFSEGHVCNGNNNQYRIEFSNSDPEKIELFRKLALDVFGMETKTYEDSRKNGNMKVYFDSKAVWNAVQSVGIPRGNKSKTKTLPEFISKSPRIVIESFYAGVIEGNGCLSGSKSRIITGSERFAKDTKILLKSLGMRCSVSEIKETRGGWRGNGSCYHIGLPRWPGMEGKLQCKKRSEIKSAKNRVSASVKSIKKVDYDGHMFDLTVEDTHCYVANGAIVSNTHCSGTAVGRGDVGVYRTGNLIIGKVLSNQGSGSSAGIAAGIRWAADVGADVISMSLGGGGSDSATNSAIDYAWAKNCYVVAAAGNDGYNGSNTIGYPAKYSNCLCCAATSTLQGAIASFSSGGSEIDFSCPGQSITSASHRGGSQTAVMSGTSMSTPYAAGTLAYIKEKQLRAGATLWGSADDARAFFTAYCKDVGAPGKDVRHGHGLLDLIKFMEKLSHNEIDLI